MSDESAEDPLGSLAEEAAKLFAAFGDLGREQGASWGRQAAGAADLAGRLAHDVDAHLATGSEECRYCPVCRIISVVRQTSPEVRAHLGDAAGSLLQAAAGLLATQPPDQDET